MSWFGGRTTRRCCFNSLVEDSGTDNCPTSTRPTSRNRSSAASRLGWKRPAGKVWTAETRARNADRYSISCRRPRRVRARMPNEGYFDGARSSRWSTARTE